MNSEKILRFTSTASICTAVTLIVLKTWAWFASGSVSILASLVDSSMDSLASLISFFSIRIALRPADKEHQFGHGKAESLAALTQAAFITGSAAFLLLHAVERLISPQPIANMGLGLGVMVVSMVLTIALVAMQKWALRRVVSQALAADSLHYVTDLLSNSLIIVALLLSQWGIYYADAIFSLFLVGWIVKSAWDIAKIALNDLMDREIPQKERIQIAQIIEQTPGVMGFHDLKTRSAGDHYFVQFHLDVFYQLTFDEAHRITDEVEDRIIEHFPKAEVIVHGDPVCENGLLVSEKKKSYSSL